MGPNGQFLVPPATAFSARGCRYTLMAQCHIIVVPDPGSGIQDSGSWIWDPGSRILDPGSRIQVQDPGFKILGPGSWIEDPGFWMWDPGSWVQDPGSGNKDLQQRSEFAAQSATVMAVTHPGKPAELCFAAS